MNVANDTIFDSLCRIFESTGIPYLVGGGFAVNAHGYARTTYDLDLIIQEEQYPILFKEFEKEGFEETYRGNVHARFSGRPKFLTNIDLLFVDSKTFQGLFAESSDKNVGPRRFKVVSLFHLIAMKLHAIKNNPENRQEKDFPDIIQLIRKNKIDPKEKKFKEMCLKHGTQELYQKILGSNAK